MQSETLYLQGKNFRLKDHEGDTTHARAPRYSFPCKPDSTPRCPSARVPAPSAYPEDPCARGKPPNGKRWQTAWQFAGEEAVPGLRLVLDPTSRGKQGRGPGAL